MAKKVSDSIVAAFSSLLASLADSVFRARVLFVVSAVFAFFGNVDVWLASSPFSFTSFLTWLLVACLNGLFYAALAGSPWRWLRVLGYVLVVVNCLLCVVNIFSYVIYGLGIGERLFTIITATNAGETSEFLSSLRVSLPAFCSSPVSLSLAAVLLLSVLAVRFLPRRVFSPLALVFCLSGFVASLFCLSLEFGKRNVNMSYRSLSWSLYAHKLASHFIHTRSLRQQNIQQSTSVSSDGLCDTFVLVIGESSSRNHWSLFGYPLNTTPRLLSMRDSLFAFSDVLPPYSTTVSALGNVLSFRNSTSDTREWYFYQDIVSISRSAHFKSFWLSNQEADWNVNKLATYGVIADEADCVQYSDASQVIAADSQRPYDEVLLPWLASTLADTAAHKLIVLHTMGSHMEYIYRFPASHRHFLASDECRPGFSPERQEFTALYDNTILYTDSLLSEMIRLVSDAPGRNALLYVSDHSEDVFEACDFYRHAVTPELAHVPMIVYLNRPYRDAHPDFPSRLLSRQDERVASENMIHSMLSLLGISCPEYRPVLDLLYPDYVCGNRFFEDKLVD